MQARKAKPRLSGGMEPGNRVSQDSRGFETAPNLVLPSAGTVLPQPGFRCHLPGSEKSGLARMSHQLLKNAEPMSSKGALMRASGSLQVRVIEHRFGLGSHRSPCSQRGGEPHALSRNKSRKPVSNTLKQKVLRRKLHNRTSAAVSIPTKSRPADLPAPNASRRPNRSRSDRHAVRARPHPGRLTRMRSIIILENLPGSAQAR